MFSDRGGDSGAIATANYTAREFGVKSGLSILSAKQKLKNRTDSAFLPADFEYYSDMSEKYSKSAGRKAESVLFFSFCFADNIDRPDFTPNSLAV